MSIVNSLPAANSHFIDLETASAMTEAYRDQHESILATAYQNLGTLPVSETFNRDAFDAILAQTGCAGVRIYFGMINGKVHAIIVGVNENNEDIILSLNLLTNEDDVIAEMSQRCPDDCVPASPLNTL